MKASSVIRSVQSVNKRVKSALISFAFFGFFLAAVLIMSAGQGSVQTSARVKEQCTLYILSYDGSMPEAHDMLFSDAAQLASRYGLACVLPDELGSLERDEVMIVLENFEDPAETVRRLNGIGIRPVVLLSETAGEGELSELTELFSKHLAQPALPVRVFDTEYETVMELNASRLEALSLYMISVNTFIESGGLTNAALIADNRPIKLIESGFLIVYGNGVNTLTLPVCGVTVMNRIVRLSDWSLEAYFSDIAG